MSSETTFPNENAQSDDQTPQIPSGATPPEPISVKVKRLILPLLPGLPAPLVSGSGHDSVHLNAEELPPPICDTCGGEIEGLDQQCPARPEGVCAP